jgi:hypothetical protein
MQTNDASIFLKNILLQTSQSNDKQIGVIIFQALYLVSACILLFVIIHMFINNKRRCLIDHISDTVMIKLVDINGKDSNLSSNNKIIKHKRNYGLPGEIVASIEDEIDSL